MTDEVLEFIHRRFKKDCNWLDGNCYYFAIILKDRFPDGRIYYDVLDGHFVYFYDGLYYDWQGIVHESMYYIPWNNFEKYDALQKQTIIRDCIL